MEWAVVVIAAAAGVAVLLTLGMVNMLVFLAMREVLKPPPFRVEERIEIPESEPPGVSEIKSKEDKLFGEWAAKQERMDRMAAMLSDLTLTQEDIVAGLGRRREESGD